MVNGFISGLTTPRNFLAVGLAGSAACNIVFPFTDSFLAMNLIWGFNAFFQSIAWPQYVRLMNEWYKPTEIGTRWSILSIANQLGSVAILLGLNDVVTSYSWKAGFWLPGIVCLAGTLILYLLPLQSYQEVSDNKHPPKRTNADDAPQTTFKDIKPIFKEIISNKLLWLIAFANMFLYVVKTGVCTWVPLYLQQAKNFSLNESIKGMMVFEIVGAAGGLFAGLASDKLFKGRRGPIGVSFMGLLLISLILLWQGPASFGLFNKVALGLTGFAIFGPQIMVGVASVDFSSQKAAVAANGCVSFFAYIATSWLTGWQLGQIVDSYGWGHAMFMLTVFTVLAAGCFMLTWHKKASQEKHKQALAA